MLIRLCSRLRDIRLGLPEEKYMVSIEYKNHLKTKASDKICFHVLQKHFDNLFRQIIREDEGGSYGVQLHTEAEDYPFYDQTFAVQFESSQAKGPRMYFSEIKNNSAMHYIETLMIELSLKKGNIARAREMIARTASTGHVDANMLTIRNQYLQHYYEKA